MDGSLELHVRGPRVLIRPENQAETTRDSGLIVIQQEHPNVIGTVIAVGDRVCDVKTGDMVLFTPESGQPMDYGEEHYLVIYEDELLAVWDEEQVPI